jgi:hypothetical protein
MKVHVETPLAVNPPEAREAWLSYQWRRGGGLPIFVHTPEENRRVIAPIMMEETILVEDGAAEAHAAQEENSIRYKVTNLGWLFGSELEKDSHSATVVFAPDGDGCIMKWVVTCQAKHRKNLWEQVTYQNIQTVANNLASYTDTPLLYTRKNLLQATSAQDAMEKWLEFCWKSGAGLPWFSPISLSETDRMYLVPFVKQKLLSLDTDKHEIVYGSSSADQAGGGGLSFLLHSYKARVQFFQSSEKKDEVEMTWTVEVRPCRGWAAQQFLRPLISAIISTSARDFQVHINEPGATVSVAPPRGKGDAFAQVPKDTWLGGVLAAHLSDRRSTMEQTMAMLQPWTWGRCTDDVDAGEGEKWTKGCLFEKTE